MEPHCCRGKDKMESQARRIAIHGRQPGCVGDEVQRRDESMYRASAPDRMPCFLFCFGLLLCFASIPKARTLGVCRSAAFLVHW